MKKLLLVLCFVCLSIMSCSALDINVPDTVDIKAKDDDNIRIYDKIKIKPDEFRHTTIMFLNSDVTNKDTKELKEILKEKYLQDSAKRTIESLDKRFEDELKSLKGLPKKDIELITPKTEL